MRLNDKKYRDFLYRKVISNTFFKSLSDEKYLKIIYRLRTGKKLDLKSPKTYNEKIQWLKIHDRNPEYTNMVDKYGVRDYISKTIGEEYLIPLIGLYNSVDEINFETLPNQFVLKCTHDSGGVVICKDKSSLDVAKAKRKLDENLKKNVYYEKREWPYKNVVPQIICETFMTDDSGDGLKDYKFFCFNGEPKAMFIASDRGIDTKFDFYDLNFNHLPLVQHYQNSKKELKKPRNFEKMIELAKKLSKDAPHLRVDFYEVNGKVYFGELTFYHFSGYEKFEPESYDLRFGEWLNLPKV